jgi:hypothetical protein
MVDRFGRLDLDGTHELPSTVCRGQDEVGKNLHHPDLDRQRLILSDVRGDVVFSLQTDLQQPDDAIVLELLADRAHEDRTHEASGKRRIISMTGRLGIAIIDSFCCNCIDSATGRAARALTYMSFPLRMMQ